MNSTNVIAADNILHPFLIDHSHIRGRMVRINAAVNDILSRHDYPDSVSRLLGEMLVIAAMLSANLKQEGILTLQAKGDGPVKFIVADATQDGTLRGYAQLNESGTLPKTSRGKTPPRLSDLLGKGYLAITLDQGTKGGRYQGIVDLVGTSLTDAISDYFTQSQQVDVAVKLSVTKKISGRGKKKHWHAGGIMIERLPQAGGIFADRDEQEQNVTPPPIGEASEDQWRRIKLFMQTVTDDELLSLEYTTWNVLKRLFGEDGVWAYTPRSVKDECRCSREKIAHVLSTIPQTEVESMAEHGIVSVNCQFCNRTQMFDTEQVNALY